EPQRLRPTDRCHLPPVELQPMCDSGFNCPCESFQRTESLIYGGRLMTAVDHAVLAFLIAASLPVVLPLCIFQQLLKGLSVSFLEEIARSLPAEEVVSRITPRGAFQVQFSLEKL